MTHSTTDSTSHNHHRRTHNLLLLQKLLTLRDGLSPFTLILDSLEQSGRGLVREVVRGVGKASKINLVFISFETLTPPAGVSAVIEGSRKSPESLSKEIREACIPSKKTLLIIDTLYPLCASPSPSFSISAFLTSIITPAVSLLATYHLDLPLPLTSPYQPSPLTLIQYLSTTIFTIHSFPQTIAKVRAAEKSLAEPVFGLGEEKDGVLLGAGANDPQWGLVVEMEHRRKSGRTVSEKFYIPRSASPSYRTTESHLNVVNSSGDNAKSSPASSKAPILLDDHPLYRRSVSSADSGAQDLPKEDDELVSSTFDLTLTPKQRDDRAGVVLPYFDAQRGEGGGGRILYDMGVEDDFDDEEDEI